VQNQEVSNDYEAARRAAERNASPEAAEARHREARRQTLATLTNLARQLIAIEKAADYPRIRKVGRDSTGRQLFGWTVFSSSYIDTYDGSGSSCETVQLTQDELMIEVARDWEVMSMAEFARKSSRVGNAMSDIRSLIQDRTKILY
jgi:hypothetical protein